MKIYSKLMVRFGADTSNSCNRRYLLTDIICMSTLLFMFVDVLLDVANFNTYCSTLYIYIYNVLDSNIFVPTHLQGKGGKKPVDVKTTYLLTWLQPEVKLRIE